MNLSELFAQSQGKPLGVQGQVVHPIYRRQVQPTERISISITRYRQAPVQGFRLKVQSGKILVGDNAEQLADAIIWTDTAPTVVVVRCLIKRPSELRLWNCWRDERDVVQAWIGNAGMVIEERDGGVSLLRCNSGRDLTFEDLVLQVDSLA